MVYLCCTHEAKIESLTLFAQLADGLTDGKLPRWHPSTTACRQHHILYERIYGGHSHCPLLFGNFSCLQLIQDKSVFLGFGLSLEEEVLCSEALGTPIGTLPMPYLRLQLLGARRSTMD